jgi:DMSO/TMAO reductase YedYZ molybdopterin-dependent catalytic subunit
MILERRRFLWMMGSTLPAALLAACDARGPRAAQRLLRLAERWNEKGERLLFRTGSMNVPSSDAPLAGRAFPSYFISPTMPVWDAASRGTWTLEVGGLVQTPLRLTLEELMKLPSVTQRVDHFCVEGWTAVAEWTGVRVSELGKRARVRPEAAYVDFESFDSGYHESWDLESALHSQTLVAYGMDGHLLGPAHGAPARLHSPIKLGYKSTKYLTRVLFLPNRTGGFWSDRGYEWYAGV